MISPDPVNEAEAYRQSLLAALAGDDPAVAQAETVAAVRALVAEAGELVRVRPEPGEWSVLECIGHLTDGELVVAGRYRWILAEDEPQIVGYDQAIWVDQLRHNEDDVEALVSLFEALRTANLELWTRTTSVDRERVGRHTERGPESLGLTFHLAGGHDRVHLAQARRALEAGRRQA